MAYIGQEPGLGEAERFVFTATAVTDTVTADDDGVTIGYTVGQVSVYLNGVKQVVGTDVGVGGMNGSTVVFDSNYAIGDVIEVIALSTFSPADTVPATGGTFTGNVTHSADLRSGNLKAADGTAAITIADSTGVVTIVDLTVSGTETILNTTTVEVEDNILQLNTTQASPDTATAVTSGISVYRGNGVTQASLIFDDADDAWDLTNDLVVAGSINGTEIVTPATLSVGVGIDALDSITTGIRNVALGDNALTACAAGGDNSAVGYAALRFNTDGDRNNAFGAHALSKNSTGTENAGFGTQVLYWNSTGNRNSALGYDALGLSTGSNNTAIGYGAGNNITSGSSNIIIGYNIDADSATGSNQLNIGNTIYGDISTGDIWTSTTGKIKQKGAFMQSSTHQALTLGY